MRKLFVAAREKQPAEAWLSRFNGGRDETERWYLGQGLMPPSSATQCRAALSRHMPELVPHYDRTCQLIGDDELAHCILSHFRPPPVVSACSHAVWLGDDGPALVRNYDFRLEIVSDRFESTSWFEREVIAKTQRPWGGCLDGMNEAGLVASLTFGGSRAYDQGFSIILMLRYVLETCQKVDEAIDALSRIPVTQAHNVTVLDRSGNHATIFIGPDREPAVSRALTSTNHQERVVWPELAAASRTVERREALDKALAEPGMTLASLVSRFFEPPLYSRSAAFPTVYSAIYRPAAGRVDYVWPAKVWTQTMARFEPGNYEHDFGDLTP